MPVSEASNSPTGTSFLGALLMIPAAGPRHGTHHRGRDGRRMERVASAGAAATASSAVRSMVDPGPDGSPAVRDAMRQERSDPLTPDPGGGLVGQRGARLPGGRRSGQIAAHRPRRPSRGAAAERLLAVQDPPARCVIGDNSNGYETANAVGLRPVDVIEVRPGEVVPAAARMSKRSTSRSRSHR